jgi:hypothetical protein
MQTAVIKAISEPAAGNEMSEFCLKSLSKLIYYFKRRLMNTRLYIFDLPSKCGNFLKVCGNIHGEL